MTGWKPCARIERSLVMRPAATTVRARRSGAASDTMNDVASKAPAAQPRLLVVDDDADMLRLLSMRLNSAGYRVSTAGSAESALAQARRSSVPSWC